MILKLMELKVYSFIDHRHEQNGFVMEQKYLGHVMDELEGRQLCKKFFGLRSKNNVRHT